MKTAAAAFFGLALTLLAACASAPRDVTDPASTPVVYVLSVNIRDGQLDAFRSLMQEMVASTKAEPGTLVYEWYLAADGKTCHIHEHFVDTAAYQAHSENFGANYAARFLPMIEVESMTLYGNADDEARAMLTNMSPVFFDAIGGFRR